MWNILHVFVFVTFVHLTLQAGADVQNNELITNHVIYVNYTGTPSDSVCERPLEFKYIYKNCRPLNASKFPATLTECDCVYCDKKVKFICYDEIWYPYNIANCNEECTAECDEKEKIPEEVLCVLGFQDKVICRCKNNCKEVLLKCGDDGQWLPPLCNDTSPVIEKQGVRVIAEITNMAYTYSCAPGHVMLQPGQATCQDGYLESKLPLCVRERPGKRFQSQQDSTVTSMTSDLTIEVTSDFTTEVTTEVRPQSLNSSLVVPTHHTPDMKTTYIILVVMIAALAVSGFVTLLIIAWCKRRGMVPRESEKTRINRQSRVRSLNLL